MSHEDTIHKTYTSNESLPERMNTIHSMGI